MAKAKSTRWEVKPGSAGNYTRIVDSGGAVLAMVTSSESDAYLMAAAPELYSRLTEVRHLKRRANGKKAHSLLPAEALIAIDAALAHAAGR